MTQINLSKSAMAAIAACIVGTAGSVAWFGTHRVPSLKVSVEIDPNSKTQIVPNTISPTQPPIVSSQPPKDNRVAIYQTEPTQNGFKTVPKSLPLQEPNQSAEENLRAAFGEMLASNKSEAKANKTGAVSTIPVGTKLLALKTESDGIHIDLSREFESGGGSTSMQSRLAQVLFTATSLEPNANVWISIEGKKLEVLGGEGLEVPYPLTRKAFQTEFESQQEP
jgi:Sporulation and spore germination